jgi:hypothetical protein
MSKHKSAKRRRKTCPICGRPRREPGLPLTVPLAVPTYWSPNQALAIFDLIDEMRDLIAAVYGPQLTEAARQQYQVPPVGLVPIPEEEPSF